jgi:hypothetical protein
MTKMGAILIVPRFTHGQLEWIRLLAGDGVVPSDA